MPIRPFASVSAGLGAAGHGSSVLFLCGTCWERWFSPLALPTCPAPAATQCCPDLGALVRLPRHLEWAGAGTAMPCPGLPARLRDAGSGWLSGERPLSALSLYCTCSVLYRYTKVREYVFRTVECYCSEVLWSGNKPVGQETPGPYVVRLNLFTWHLGVGGRFWCWCENITGVFLAECSGRRHNYIFKIITFQLLRRA